MSLRKKNGLHSKNNIIKKLEDSNELIKKAYVFFLKKRKAMKNSQRTKSCIRKSWPKYEAN